jgi:hypothetical protein
MLRGFYEVRIGISLAFAESALGKASFSTPCLKVALTASALMPDGSITLRPVSYWHATALLVIDWRESCHNGVRYPARTQ